MKDTTAHAPPAASGAGEPEPVPGDLRMVRALWPVLLASAVGLLPFTVFGTFLVPIAEGADSTVVAMGSLRGLGGLAALAVGVLLAPLIDRVPKEWAAAAGLAVLGIAALLGAVGHFLALAAFCLLVGAATAVLTPALAAAAADRFGSGAAAGRAATLVTATQSLTAMLAAPAVALPALVWGWQGTLVGVALLALLLGGLLLRGGPLGGGDGPPHGASRERAGYLASFRALAAVPGAVPLLLVALLRTAAFMGYLAYLAAFYDERFHLEPALFALVWTLSGASFFAGNYLAGRYTNSAAPRVGAERMLRLGLGAALACVTCFYLTHNLATALLLTALLGACHAVVAACVVSLIVRRCGELRGAALGVNAAGMSLGVFAGAALGGLGLGVAGYPGVAAALGGCTLLALVAACWVRGPRRPLLPWDDTAGNYGNDNH